MGSIPPEPPPATKRPSRADNFNTNNMNLNPQTEMEAAMQQPIPRLRNLPFKEQALDSARHPVSIEDETDEFIRRHSSALASGRGCGVDAMSSSVGRPENLPRA